MAGGLGDPPDNRVERDVRKAGTGEKRQGRETAQVGTDAIQNTDVPNF